MNPGLTLAMITQGWREKAARLRDKYKGMGQIAQAGIAAATALETCAEEIESYGQPSAAVIAKPDSDSE